MTRRAAAVLAAAALLLMGLAGCVRGPSPGPGAPEGPAEVVFTSLKISEPVTLDPAVAYEVIGGAVLQQVVEPLVYYDKASVTDLVPVLAAAVPSVANGGLSADGLRYTFTLKPGVRFHDGRVLTADDVKFSLDRVILMNAPGGPAWMLGEVRGAAAYMRSLGTAADRAAYLAAEGVQVLGPLTVRVTLDRPDAAFLYKLAFTVGSIVPRMAFLEPRPERATLWGASATFDGLPPPAVDGNGDGDVGDVGDRPAPAADPWADRHAVGTGPFRLERWQGGEVVLARFAEHHRAPLPVVDKVVIRKVDDLAERLRLLRERQADDVYVAVGDLRALEGMRDVRVLEAPSFNVDVLMMTRNVTDRAMCPVDAVTGEADCRFFDDLPMRKVFAHAMDGARLLREVAQGHASPLAGIIPKLMFGHDWDLAPHPHDPAAALAQLALSRHPGGFRLTLAYNEGNALREGAARILKEGLEALSPSIRVEVRALPWATDLLPRAQRGALPAVFLGWGPDYAFPDDYVVPFGHSQKGVFSKFARIQDPTLDALIDEALATVNPVQLQRQYAAIQARMHEDVTYLYLAQANHVHVEGAWVEGYFHNPIDAGQPNVGHYRYVSKAGAAAASSGALP